MTSSFVAEANKLKNVQVNLQKSEKILIEQISKQDGSSDIKEFIAEIDAAREKEFEGIRKDLRDIYKPLEKLKNKIGAEKFKQIDLTMMKKDMVALQSNLQNMRYKQKTMLEKLEREEKELLAEMSVFEERFSKWDNRVTAIQTSTCIVPKRTENSMGFCPEVCDFLKFVTESNGHQGGWTPDDHNLFIKIRSRYKNNVKQMANCFHGLCPDLTVTEILAHEEWYKKYCDLKEKQRLAIKKWRDNKNKELAKKVKEAEEEAEKVKAEPSVGKKKDHEEDIQEKIENWKKLKEQQKQEELEEKRKAELRQKEMEDRKKLEAEDLKMDLRVWKHEKATKAQEEKLQRELQELKEKEFRVANAKKLIKHFQSQDDVFIERMRRSRKPKRSSSLEKVRKSNAPRDPERLLRPTKQWIFRTMPKKHDDPIEYEPKQVCNIRYVPKLGVPMWRKCAS